MMGDVFNPFLRPDQSVNMHPKSGKESGASAGRLSVADETMAALRTIGLLGEIWESADGLFVYPNAEAAHVGLADGM